MSEEHSAGFRIVGPCTGERLRVHGPTAYAAYARCDPKARIGTEAYTSAFWFALAAFRDHLERHGGSPAGYAGSAWAPRLTFDIDREGDVPAAMADARRLVAYMVEQLAIPIEALAVFWSGCKGFAIDLHTGLWAPEPATDFPGIAREFCEGIAREAGVATDPAVYGRLQPIRAPNSRHPKSGLFKRRIDTGILLDGVTAAGVLGLAKNPEAFDPSSVDGIESADFLAGRWDAAARAVTDRNAAADERRAAIANGEQSARLNRMTRLFITGEVDQGDRHRLLYSAARNLRELGCPLSAVRELLTEPARDMGLPPKDIERGITCGVEGT